MAKTPQVPAPWSQHGANDELRGHKAEEEGPVRLYRYFSIGLERQLVLIAEEREFRLPPKTK